MLVHHENPHTQSRGASNHGWGHFVYRSLLFLGILGIVIFHIALIRMVYKEYC